MHFKNNKSKIYFNIDRKIDEIPYLFIHGFTNNHTSWKELRKTINQNTIAIDIPGHGKSTFNDLSTIYTYDDWANEFFLCLKRINVNKIKLCGYSMGGRLALYFAIKYPNYVDELFLESTNLGIESWDSRLERYNEDLELCENINNNFKLFLEEWEKMPFFINQRKRNERDYLQQKIARQNNNPKQLSKSLHSFSVGNIDYLYDGLSTLKCKINIINGNDDFKYIKFGKDMLKANNNCFQYIVNNASHNIHLENLNDYANIIFKRI